MIALKAALLALFILLLGVGVVALVIVLIEAAKRGPK